MVSDLGCDGLGKRESGLFADGGCEVIWLFAGDDCYGFNDIVGAMRRWPEVIYSTMAVAGLAGELGLSVRDSGRGGIARVMHSGCDEAFKGVIRTAMKYNASPLQILASDQSLVLNIPQPKLGLSTSSPLD
ncbi:PREDICTED: PRUPE_5G072900 [Prunus dulcis]|uniref:PREDICTED: PRUPE_5G072900 n=1 Tax=Prunus dulcis TaxID=3755 RepID=A0A5E4F2W5_PRUDU|nr:PREDICTED: PRUPE_5G072900 [Prunus dulcis]